MNKHIYSSILILTFVMSARYGVDALLEFIQAIEKGNYQSSLRNPN